MPDEIDLLRRFRDHTPEPDDAAWEKARSAVTAAQGKAAGGGHGPAATKRLVVGWGQAADGGHGQAADRGHGRWRSPRRRTLVVAAVAVAAAVAAGFVTGALRPAPSLAKPLVTGWQPAQALPSSVTGLRVQAGSWRLLSYLIPQGWAENTSGPEDGALTCPTTQSCYVEGDNASSPSGPADWDTLYVSADGAETWSTLPVPAGVTFTSALACTTARDCAAGGLYYGHQAVYLTTTTGGHSWTIAPLPAGDGQIEQLACATATSCRGLTETSSQVPFPNYASVRPGIEFIATADGGRHFTVTPFPAGTAMMTVSCPTSTHCVAFGVPVPGPKDKAGPELTKGIVLVSDDAGASWRAGTLPGNVGTDGSPQVTCTDAARCMLLGYVIGPGSQSGSMSVSASGKITETVPDQYSVVGFSTDGGLRWTIRRLPASIPYPSLSTLACPTASLCYAAGGAAIPQRVGDADNGGSSVVAVTRDAGRTWQRVSFAVPAKVPSGMEADSFAYIGQLQCPAAGACVALGASHQGSKSTPVYTNHG
jgi:hypothetical protein